jgi:hypothetical protein
MTSFDTSFLVESQNLVRPAFDRLPVHGVV